MPCADICQLAASAKVWLEHLVYAAVAGNHTSSNIFLDNVNDQRIVNHYHRHHFFPFKYAGSYSTTLSGISSLETHKYVYIDGILDP